MELNEIANIDITNLIKQGLYYGLLMSIFVGLVSQGLNYAIKLLKRS